MRPLTRRRLLILAAAAAAVPLSLPEPGVAAFTWTGTALGADAAIHIAGLDRDRAAAAVRAASDEVERLEQAFSLYRPESELARLNRDGQLAGPSQDFRVLMERSLAYWQATGGAFNPAIQPVWRFLARHFEKRFGEPDGAGLAQALRLCDPAAVEVAAAHIRLRPGMALTFNGIAQGYITDRVAAALRDRGLRSVLLNLGELRALPGMPWPVAIEDTDRIVSLSDAAMARSSGRATPLSADGRWHHLIDPRTGESARFVADVTVTAPTATEADALSTALFVSSAEQRQAIVNRYPAMRIL